MSRSRVTAHLLVAFATATAVVAAPVSASAATEASQQSCPAGADVGTVEHWVGGAGSWSDAAKWSDGTVPGLGSRSTVCIPAGSDIVIDATTPRVDLRLLDLGRGSHLTLEPGTALYLWFDPLSRRSVVRPNAVLEVDGATFGGHHRLRVMGTFAAHRSTGGSPAILTSKPVAATGRAYPGLLEIGDQGVLDISGSGNVKLKRKYVVDVHGLARLRDDAGLVADHGTSFLLQKRFNGGGAGRLVIRNDHGFAEGAGNGTGLQATFVNRGAIIKKDSTGTSHIVARSFEEGGAVRELTGDIVVPPPIVQAPATDTCGDEESCNPRQEASLKIPATDADGSGVDIATLPGAKPSNLSKYVGVPMRVHAGDLDATAADPAIIRFHYANSLFVEAGVPADPAKLQVAHANTADQPYTDIPVCVGRGIQTAYPSCLDRKASTKVAGGVMLVVRTIDTSRWVVH